MKSAGLVNPEEVNGYRERVARHKIRFYDAVKRILWWIGFVLLLPASCGWFSEFPVHFFEAFPYPVDSASNIWVRRMIMTTVAGLVCWASVGLIYVVDSLRIASYAELSLQARIARLFVITVTLATLVSAGAALLFLALDVSDIPQ